MKHLENGHRKEFEYLVFWYMPSPDRYHGGGTGVSAQMLEDPAFRSNLGLHAGEPCDFWSPTQVWAS